MYQLEYLIMYNIALFSITKDMSYRNTALALLKTLAKKYHVTIENKQKVTIQIALEKFEKNETGYKDSISYLYHSL
jgi:hypothetical protein